MTRPARLSPTCEYRTVWLSEPTLHRVGLRREGSDGALLSPALYGLRWVQRRGYGAVFAVVEPWKYALVVAGVARWG